MVFVGDYRRSWLWANAQSRTVRGKLTGFTMELDLSQWADRATYFLGRWVDLEMQAFIEDVIRPGDQVVDVGANRGMFTLCASRLVGPEGKVLSFRAQPDLRQPA